MENQTKPEVMKREQQQQQEDVEDDDETKMEKFYSLIRSFREARDRRSQELAEMSKRRRLGLDHNHHHHHVQSPSPSSLSPLITSPISFEMRDFTAPVGAGAQHLPLSPSPPSAAAGGDDNSKRQKRREDSEEELNLNLSL